MNEKLSSMLIRHEGLKLRAYFCPAGKITVGVGRNLEDVGLSENEALLLLENDIQRAKIEISQEYDWFLRLNDARQDVILSMVFNLGITRFRQFKQLISAIAKQDWERAASEMTNSKWASQTGKRATELADMMRVGKYLDAR